MERRARGDLIETFKIYKEIANYGTNLFRFSRNGYNILYPLGKRSVQQDDFFNTRVIESWNKLPHYIKDSNSVDTFKARLEAYKNECTKNHPNVSMSNYWSLSSILLGKIENPSRDAHIKFLVNNPEIAKLKKTNIHNACVYD